MSQSRPCFLAIDIGTSSLKVAIIDARGCLLGLASRPYPIHFPAPGRAEQDPADWISALGEAVPECMETSGIDPLRIAGIGLTGQSPTHIWLDAAGRPLTPALTWQDNRAAAEAEWLSRKLGGAEWIGLIGAQVPHGPSWPAARLLWLRRRGGELHARARRMVQPKDLIYWHLTGTWATDAATWRGLVHQRLGTVSPELLELIGAPAELIPPVHAPWSASASLNRSAAAELQLPAGIPVSVGWNDTCCHILGSGLGIHARGFDISGTSEIAGVLCGTPATEQQVPTAPGLLALPLLGELTAIYGATQAGGSSLQWAARATGGSDLAVLMREAGAVPAGSGRLIFLPYLHGERAPLWDTTARGVYFGLSGLHGRGHLIRAALEGVAFSIRHIHEVCASTSGAPPAIVVTGGGSRLDLWNQIKADVLGCPVIRTTVQESGLLGAAMLCATAVGAVRGPAEAAAAMVKVDRIWHPDPSNREIYDQLYGVYRRLYLDLRDRFRELEEQPEGPPSNSGSGGVAAQSNVTGGSP